MAKQTQSFSIDAKQAVAALGQITAAAKNYNAEVTKANKVQKDLRESSKDARNSLQSLVQPLSQLQQGIGFTRAALSGMRDDMRAQSRIAKQLVSNYSELNSTVASLNKVIQKAESVISKQTATIQDNRKAIRGAKQDTDSWAVGIENIRASQDKWASGTRILERQLLALKDSFSSLRAAQQDIANTSKAIDPLLKKLSQASAITDKWTIGTKLLERQLLALKDPFSSLRSAQQDLGNASKAIDPLLKKLSQASTLTDKWASGTKILARQLLAIKDPFSSLRAAQQNVGNASKAIDPLLKKLSQASAVTDKWTVGTKLLERQLLAIKDPFSSLRSAQQNVGNASKAIDPLLQKLSQASAITDKWTIGVKILERQLAALKPVKVSPQNDPLFLGPIKEGIGARSDSSRVFRPRISDPLAPGASGALNAKFADGLKTLRETDVATQNLTNSFNSLQHSSLELRVAIGVLISTALHRFITTVIDATGEAKEFSKRIAEVQTVSLETSNGILKSAKSTEEWRGELSALSRAFGVPILETTEALYQALSNQVVTASNATSFLANEMKLAATTASTLDQAVSVTSTVINAFGKNAGETERINSALFRGVELGRFRLDELGSSFGKVSVISRELGISYEEQIGALALLTQKGLQAEAAATFLTNVETHLIKPTAEMTKLFDAWGVSSGEAAVRAFGAVGVIQKLAQAAEASADPMEFLGGVFQDIRAVVGGAGLVRSFGDLDKIIKEVSNSTDHYNKANEIVFNSLGKRADIELQKVRLEFITLGDTIVRVLLNLSDLAGGADKLLGWVKTAIRLYIEYRVALVAANLAINAYNASIIRATISTQGAAAAANTAKIAFLGLNAARGAITLGVGALVFALGELSTASVRAEHEARLASEAFKAEGIKRTREELEKIVIAIDAVNKKNEILAANAFRPYAQFLASVRAVNTSLLEDFDKTFKKIKDVISDTLGIGVDLLDKRLKDLTKSIEKTRKTIDDLREREAKTRVELADKGFEEGLVGATDEDAIRRSIARKRELDAQALAALRRGELDLSDDLVRRSEKLQDSIEARLNKFKAKVEKDSTEITTRLSTTGRFTRTVDDGDTRSTFSVSPPGRPRVTRGFFGAGRGVDAFAVTRRAPRSSLTIETKTVLTDTERIRQLEEQILRLREGSTATVRERLAAEAAGRAAEERRLAALEAEETRRKKALDTFKVAVAEIDAFDKKDAGKDAASKFGGLLTNAENAGKAAGLSPTEQLQFLREAQATRIRLERETQVQVIKERLDAAEKAQKDIEAKDKAARERKVSADKSAAQKTLDFVEQNLDRSRNIREQFGDNLNSFKITEFRSSNVDLNKFNELKKQLFDSLTRFDELNKHLEQTQQTGGNTTDILSRISKEQDTINQLLLFLSNTKGIVRRGALPGSPLFGDKDVAKDASGRVLDADGKAVADNILASKKALTELKTALTEVAKARQSYNSVSVLENPAIRQELEKQLALLQKMNLAQAELIRLKKLERDIFDAAGPPTPGVPVIPRASGGSLPGTDRSLVALTDGELVMNRLATRQYAPLLRALNTMQPPLRSGGGDVSFGDISIHTTTNTSTAQAQEIGQELVRLVRMGRLKLN